MLQYVQMLFLLLGRGIQRRKKTAESKVYLDKKQTDTLKAFCSIIVMLGHFAIAMDGYLMKILNRSGILGVGFFFFISGYGLMEGLRSNPQYLQGFLVRRSKTLLIPFLISHISMLGIRVAMKLIKFTDLLSVKEVFGLVNWYIYVIAFFYILFFVIYKRCSQVQGTIIITIIIILMNFFLYLIEFKRLFYGGNICFLIGLWISLFQKEVFIWLEKNYIRTGIISIATLMLGIFLFIRMGYGSFLGDFFGRNIASLSVVILIILFLMKFEWHNKLLRYLSNMYYEIYLVHAYILCIYEEKGIQIYNNSYTYYFAGLVLSFGLAVSLHYISSLIQKKVGSHF